MSEAHGPAGQSQLLFLEIAQLDYVDVEARRNMLNLYTVACQNMSKPPTFRPFVIFHHFLHFGASLCGLGVKQRESERLMILNHLVGTARVDGLLGFDCWVHVSAMLASRL